MVLVFFIMAFFSTVVVWFGSNWLDHSSQKISKYFRLPEVVQGGIIAAVGSSAPELSSTVLSTTLHGEFVLGVSAIVGSAIFNILVIPGLSALYARGGGGVRVSKDVVKGDGLFYTLSCNADRFQHGYGVFSYFRQSGWHNESWTRFASRCPLRTVYFPSISGNLRFSKIEPEEKRGVSG